MHPSALKYGELFFKTYLNYSGDNKSLIVDIGAQDINGSLRQFMPKGCEYIGVDFEAGRGVDVVLTDPYKLPFDSGSVDAVVCSSVFEHSEFFWLLFVECIRILKPSGVLYLNAPSNGQMHRYPIDSWRFYPDAGKALANWARHNGYRTALVESFIGSKLGNPLEEGMWNDFIAIFVADEVHMPVFQSRMVNAASEVYFEYSNGADLASAHTEFMPDQILLETKIKKIQELQLEVDNLEKFKSEYEKIITSKKWYWITILDKTIKFLKKLVHISKRPY
jgi:SAM-dependent methyltransferase